MSAVPRNVQNFDRPATAGLDLTIDTFTLTGRANDYRCGYGIRDLPAGSGVGKPGDVLVVSSTSGRSSIVVRTLTRARELGITSVAVTRDPRDMELADFVLAVPASESRRSK